MNISGSRKRCKKKKNSSDLFLFGPPSLEKCSKTATAGRIQSALALPASPPLHTELRTYHNLSNTPFQYTLIIHTVRMCANLQCSYTLHMAHKVRNIVRYEFFSFFYRGWSVWSMCRTRRLDQFPRSQSPPPSQSFGIIRAGLK